MAGKISAKRIAIDRANAIMFGSLAAAAFVVAFSLVASSNLFGQYGYQKKVIDGKKTALKQAKTNLEEVNALESSYKAFKNQNVNVLGGNPTGTGPKDGDNPRLILDALPEKYDFPALLSSVEKILTDEKVVINEIEGKDDEVTQAKNASSPTPKPVDMPFSVTVSGAGLSMKPILGLFERSIRPMKLQKLEYKSDNSDEPQITIDLKSYYQPGKNFNIKLETVK